MTSDQGGGLFDALRWRLVGPFRGGRVVAVAGHPQERGTFYFGSTGGGVWKTTDRGSSWQNVSDGYLKTTSVGALALAPSDPNVLYAGMGESCIRNNVANGDGVYRSIDGGRSWTHRGLEETQHISRVRIDPQDPDLVYVAALGHAFGPNPERGVYRSKDGGETWEQILHRGPETGAADLALDPRTPRVLYAALWQTMRSPWRLDSGGPESGLWRSDDGGDHWVDLTRRPGLPEGVLGRIGVTASPARAGRVWAIVEAEDGAVFRSDDYGEHWTRLSEQGDLRWRAWYYQHLFADPVDENTIWAFDIDVWLSHDGGAHFDKIPVAHGDAHDLWIDPADQNRLIMGCDGGATVSLDYGTTWSTLHNQPTAELYHVTADTRQPYRIYAAQQDNSTISLPSHSEFGVIGSFDTYPVGGGESGHIAVRPDDPDIIFAGSYLGLITRYDHRRRTARAINVWPESMIGSGADEARFRFNWTAPILISPHDPGVLYHGGNRLFRSQDDGQTWEAISPDLSRNDPETQRSSGGPVTADNTGAEYYGCIFALAESPLERGLLWAGTDDGLVQLSRDGGATWTACTPRDFPDWAHVSAIEASPHAAGTAFLVADAHRLDDPRPYLWRTRDYGATWDRLDGGLPPIEFCHVLRQDPQQPQILYCGTETGAHVSLDEGATWRKLGGNLPVVAIHDLIIEGDDLVAATHGRSIWILDDLPAVRQHRADLGEQRAHLYRPRTVVRYPVNNQLSGGTPGVRDYKSGGTAVIAFDVRHASTPGETEAVPVDAGVNRPGGVTVLYRLRDPGDDDLELSFLDEKGEVIRTFRASAEKGSTPPAEGPKELEPPREAGLNHFTWDTRHDPGTLIERDPPRERHMPEPTGPKVPPGTYTVQLKLGDLVLTESCEVLEDPRNPATPGDLQEQYALAKRLWQLTSELNQGVNRIRDLKAQLVRWCEEGRAAEIGARARALRDTLTEIERELVQVEPKGSRRLSNPDRLDGKLRSLQGLVDAPARPPSSTHAVTDELARALELALGRLRTAIDRDLADFNRALVQAGTGAVTLEG